MIELSTVITSLITSSGAGVILLWLTRNWLSERLKQSIQHEYEQKLEAHKAKLKAENDVALEQLKISISAQVELNKIGHERTLVGIEKLWESILTIDENTPSIVSLVDVLTKDEYKTSFDNQEFRNEINKLNGESMMAGTSQTKEFENCRPFIGEYLWSLFFSYRAIAGRMVFLIKNNRDTGSRVHWLEDKLIRKHLTTLLSKQELDDVYSSEITSFQKVREYIKQKILNTSTQIVSGQRSAADSLDLARQIVNSIYEPSLGSKLK